MKYSIYLSDSKLEELEFEIVSQELRVYLTRLIERDENFRSFEMINKNFIINRSRTLLGKSIYVLDSEDHEPAEYAWHAAEFELALRRGNTIQFIELLCEILERNWIGVSEVNNALKKEKLSFRVALNNFSASVKVLSLAKVIEDTPDEDEHPNIRVLVERMQSALEAKDFSSVLHSSASIFETLAKDIIGTQTIQDQTLGSFFSQYQNRTNLSSEIQQKIIDTYKARNTEPLAGHGSTSDVSLSESDAITLSELTKAFVKIEYSIERVANN